MYLSDRLPNEVWLLILSFLTTKEVRRTSMVSKSWRRWLLGYYPKLNFENSRTMNVFKLHKNQQELVKERSIFIKRVEDVMKQHLSTSIDEFRVVFDLDESCQSNIEIWVSFALKKRVKNLVLDLTPPCFREGEEYHSCSLTPDDWCKPVGIKHALTSLSLKYVSITSGVVEIILDSCPFLESLFIEEPEFLTSIKSSALSLSLKHLDVSRCHKLRAINISAPKLTFLRYMDHPLELDIKNASSLTTVSIGWLGRKDTAFAFESLSRYLPQLEALYLGIITLSTSRYDIGGEHHLPLPDLPLLSKLKVLEFVVFGCHLDSLLGWTPLIDACPMLEKLTLQLRYCADLGINSNSIKKRNGSPLKNLRTLEILGYCGRRGDIELATFILENTVILQEVIVYKQTYPSEAFELVKTYDPIPISELKEKVPQGARLTIMESTNGYFRGGSCMCAES